jgi:hypothetical protein
MSWSASTSNAIADGAVKYVGIEYNAGSPQVVSKDTDTWTKTTEFPLGTVVREGTVLHFFNNPMKACSHGKDIIHRLYDTDPLAYAARKGGIILGETGTRNLTLTEGELYDRSTEFEIGALDTSAADTFDSYYDDGAGGWTKTTGNTQWDNTQYDDGSGTLATMTNNRYGSHWFYVDAEDGELVHVYGTDNAVAEGTAEESDEPTGLPLRIQTHCKLIAKLVFQKSAGTASVILSKVATGGGSGVAVTDHGELSGLADDDHTQYLLADGTRALAGAWDMGSFALTNVNIDSGVITGITDLAVADGGTGASNAGDARTNLGLVIGTDVLAQQTIGIADNNLVEIDHAAVADNDYAKFTANGLEGRSYAEVKADLSLEDADIETLAQGVSINNLSEDSTPQLGGDLDTNGNDIILDENDSFRLDPTLSADGKWTGTIVYGTAGATLAFGDLVYLAAADSRWELVDASAVGTSGTVLIGMCIFAAAADGIATRVLLHGTVRADAAFPTFTVSAPIYASETAGDVTNTAPTTADAVVRVVGYGIDGNTMYFNPSPDHITHTGS